MDSLKLQYNKLLDRVKKYCELPKEQQDKYEKQLMGIMCDMDMLLVDIDMDPDEYQNEILNGFEVKP
jgi:hypothetical protein